jgi:hypothetical protein
MPLDRSTIEEFRMLPLHLRRVALGIPTRCQAARPKAGGFSLVEHACHLRDFEREGVQLRIERTIRESEPDLADFPGDRLAAERGYLKEEFGAALRSFERSRNDTVRLLGRLSDEQLERPARFASEGRVSLLRLVRLFAEHDASHRADLDQLVIDLSAAGLRRA